MFGRSYSPPPPPAPLYMDERVFSASSYECRTAKHNIFCCGFHATTSARSQAQNAKQQNGTKNSSHDDDDCGDDKRTSPDTANMHVCVCARAATVGQFV